MGFLVLVFGGLIARCVFLLLVFFPVCLALLCFALIRFWFGLDSFLIRWGRGSRWSGGGVGGCGVCVWGG